MSYDGEWLYIPLYKVYNKKRNLLKTVTLQAKGNLTPSSPPILATINSTMSIFQLFSCLAIKAFLEFLL